MFFRPRNYYYNKNALNAAFVTSSWMGGGRGCHCLMEIPFQPGHCLKGHSTAIERSHIGRMINGERAFVQMRIGDGGG